NDPGYGVSTSWPETDPSSIADAAPSGVYDGCTKGYVRPAMARSSIVVTSSGKRLPLGNPARSPPTTPHPFGFDVGEIAMFRRSMSPGSAPVKFWNPGTIPDGMPVSKIASRSARDALNPFRFGNTPGYKMGRSVASSGCA